MIKLRHACYFRCVALMLCDLPLPHVPLKAMDQMVRGKAIHVHDLRIGQA